MPPARNLKAHILKGGFYLTLRNLLAAGLSLISVLVIARMLGPENYGIATVALGTFYFLIWTTPLGLNAYLVRQPELPQNGPQQIITFYNTVGMGLCGLLWLAAPLVGWWTGQAEVAHVLRWLIPALWLNMLSLVSIAMMERELRFAEVGLVETLAQLANYLVAVPLVLGHWSYWGPVMGTIVQFAVQLVLGYRFYPLSWRWQWQWKFLGPALHYGLTYSGSDWILHFRSLRIPLLVSSILGVEAAGIAGIASRLVDQMSMLRYIVRRMSISVMAKMLGDAEATRRTISQGMAYQSLLVGFVCAAFASCGTWLIPLLFGKEWLLSAQIFPLIALGVLISSIFDLHASSLYAAGHNRDVAVLNFWYVGISWLASFVFLSMFGLWGYGLSEIVSLPCFFLVHRSLSKLCGVPNYGTALWLILVAAVPLIVGPFIHPALAILLLLVGYGAVFAINPEVRKIPLELLSAIRSRTQKVTP